jgi:RraA family protein
MYAMSAQIKNLVNDAKIIGSACTVKCFPGDNLMVHKALDIANPGDIIVVDASGSTTTAVIGDLIAQKAKHRGIAGFVIDGLIRDFHDVRRVGLPIFAKGVTPVGPLHRGPGEINFPICCGGIVVNSGDIIAADTTGVVVVRADFAEALLTRLEAQRASLEAYVASVARGDFSNAWVDRILEEALCGIAE